MKLKLLASAFVFAALPFVAQATTPQIATPAPVVQVPNSTSTDWQVCLNFILSTSTKLNFLTLLRLSTEVALGTHTWVVVEPVGSGPGLGWPDSNMVIEFESEEDTAIAANLLISATNN